MDEVIRFYISEEVSKSVANSQMFNWGEVLAKKGLETRFVIFYRSKERLLKMIKDTDQPIIRIRTVKFFILRNLIYLSVLVFLYIRSRKHYNRIIFQSRAIGASPALAILRLLPQVRVITDIRGIDLPLYSDGSFKTRFRHFNFDLYSWISLKGSDRIFCVSNFMAKLICERYRIVNKNITVIGGVADAQSFYFNGDLRYNLRKQYNFENRIVIIYSGMLDKPWQLPEKYFQLFSSLLTIKQNLVLILLTPNVDIAEELKKKYRIDNNLILIKESSYKDLVKFYNLADFGLLLRKNEIVNNVASPTKFSEYSLCGLPIIISDKIGDFSDYIKSSGFGYVVRNTEDIFRESVRIARFLENSDFDRQQISEFSYVLFSKNSKADEFLTIINKLW